MSLPSPYDSPYQGTPQGSTTEAAPQEAPATPESLGIDFFQEQPQDAELIEKALGSPFEAVKAHELLRGSRIFHAMTAGFFAPALKSRDHKAILEALRKRHEIQSGLGKVGIDENASLTEVASEAQDALETSVGRKQGAPFSFEDYTAGMVRPQSPPLPPTFDLSDIPPQIRDFALGRAIAGLIGGQGLPEIMAEVMVPIQMAKAEMGANYAQQLEAYKQEAESIANFNKTRQDALGDYLGLVKELEQTDRALAVEGMREKGAMERELLKDDRERTLTMNEIFSRERVEGARNDVDFVKVFTGQLSQMAPEAQGNFLAGLSSFMPKYAGLWRAMASAPNAQGAEAAFKAEGERIRMANAQRLINAQIAGDLTDAELKASQVLLNKLEAQYFVPKMQAEIALAQSLITYRGALGAQIADNSAQGWAKINQEAGDNSKTTKALSEGFEKAIAPVAKNILDLTNKYLESGLPVAILQSSNAMPRNQKDPNFRGLFDKWQNGDAEAGKIGHKELLEKEGAIFSQLKTQITAVLAAWSDAYGSGADVQMPLITVPERLKDWYNQQVGTWRATANGKRRQASGETYGPFAPGPKAP